ncbi:MAG: cytochrome c3 family protein [Gemmatimonadales bacterium]
MSKRFVLGLGVVTMAMALLATAALPGVAQKPATGPAPLSAADSSSLKGPRQPIFFRHDIHTGQLKMQCQYCHYSVGVSSEPGIPSMQTCMGCHIAVAGKTDANKAEIKKLKEAWSAKKPVEWVRVHSVARHVRFPHARHIKALGPAACATCHGNVSRMPQVYKVNNVNNMGFCISCHIERKVSRDCTVCHY